MFAARAKRLYKTALQLRANLQAIAPVRPVVVMQSDDWGRVGTFTESALSTLKGKGYNVGESIWDYYGLESEEDLSLLAGCLGDVRDADGRKACFTANFVMANADIRRMQEEEFREFRDVPIMEGFPAPWKERLMPVYRDLVDNGIFYPGLHGYTHFSPHGFIKGIHEKDDLGTRIRALVDQDIPYLASLTPEYNFALLERLPHGERFASSDIQETWIKRGIGLFKTSFGVHPLTVCAPGYRANETTYSLWKKHGIESVQVATGSYIHEDQGLFVIPRNVFFEPAISEVDSLQKALNEAEKAVRAGCVISICSHSINYMQRHCRKRDFSLSALSHLLKALLKRYPDLRYANVKEVLDAWNDKTSGWFRNPHFAEMRHRVL